MATRVVLAAALLAACTTPEPVRVVETVEVPRVVYEQCEAPPDWLSAPYRPDRLPEFIAPIGDGAAVALTDEGAERLRALLRELTGRLDAWRAWSAPPEQ